MTPSRDRDDEDDWEDTVYIGADWDDEPTIPCPYCRRDILEDSPRCPYCERDISEEDHAGPSKSVWVMLCSASLPRDRDLVGTHGVLMLAL